MIYPFKIFITFFLSFVVTIFLLPSLSKIASLIRLLDYPSKRKVHNNPKPIVGGLAIGIAFIFSSSLFIPEAHLIGYYSGIIIVLIVGLLDDFKGLNCNIRFAMQILASLFIIFFSDVILKTVGDLLSTGPINLGIFAIPATIFCTVGVINAINMIDGIDGLAGGISFIALLSFTVLASLNSQMDLMLLSLALSGAVAGFLRYNWYPSKLFIGDAGSLILGFSLAFLSIAITQENNTLVPPVVPLLVLAVPVVDTVTIMVKRMLKGKNPFKADKYHLHHILLRFGFDKEIAERSILLLSFMFSSIAILGVVYKIQEYYLFSVFMIYFSVYFIASFYIKDLLRLKIRMMRKWKAKVERVKEGTLGEYVTKIHRVFLKIKNLRNHPRYPLRLSFTCITEVDNKEVSGELLDLGLRGYSGTSNHSLQQGEKIKVNILLPLNGKKANFFAIAEVVWMCNGSDCYRYGFRFENVDERQRSVLREYLGNQAR